MIGVVSGIPLVISNPSLHGTIQIQTYHAHSQIHSVRVVTPKFLLSSIAPFSNLVTKQRYSLHLDRPPFNIHPDLGMGIRR